MSFIDGDWRDYLTNMDLKPKKANRKELLKLMQLAKRTKAGLTLTDVPDIQWYGYYFKNKLVAFSALFIRKKECRLRSSFIHPNYRGNGFYWKILAHRIQIAEEAGCEKITGWSNEHSLECCKRLGFDTGKTNRNNVTFIFKTLNDG